MKLLFLDKVIGDISDVSQDGPEMWASFEPGREAAPLLVMWRFITDENNYEKEPPFPQEYLNDESWAIIDDQGQKHPVCLPAVYGNGDIALRWRREHSEE